MTTVNINYDLNATLEERLAWWEEEKTNCEQQVEVAHEHHDCATEKSWKNEVKFCEKNIKNLKAELVFYSK